MFESNGNTPEPAQDSTTRIAELVKAVETRQATLEAQASTILELEARVAGAVNELELMRARSLMAEETIRDARKSIEDVLAGDLDPATTFEEFREAFELLGVKATREVEIEISVTWRGTIELPLGVEVDDLDVDDFGISIDGHHEYDSYINNHFDVSSIDER